MADGLTEYTCTPRQVRKHVTRILAAGRVPMIKSSPGLGKSSIIRSVTSEFGLKLIDHRLSTSMPEDLTGLPRFVNGKAEFAPFSIFPLEDDPVPEGYDGWVLFFDEFNSADRRVMAAAYKVILDRMIGQYKLHPRVAIVAAGNQSTDKAIVNNIGTAMQSRLITLNMIESLNEWVEDVALPNNYDNRIIAFLNWKPEYLMDFRPYHQENTFCCPRTWEFMNDLIKGQPVSDEDASLFAGTITSGVAVEFIRFTNVYKSLPPYSAVIANPETHAIPQDAATRWATIFHLIEKLENKDFADLAKYMERWDTEFRVLFYRVLIQRKPELRNDPIFAQAVIKISRYLND